MLLLLLACNARETDTSGEKGMVAGEAVSCSSPVEGFFRLNSEGASHGLTGPGGFLMEGGVKGGMVNVHDIDGDGDYDLLFADEYIGLPIYENLGNGQFQLTPDNTLPGGSAQVLGDLNGDNLPELISARPGGIYIFPNLGGMQFGDGVEIIGNDLPYSIPGSLSLGDMDGDQDLDLMVSALEYFQEACEVDHSCEEERPNPGSPQVLYRNNGGELVEGVFTPAVEFYPHGEPGYSVASIFTDRDNDGDQDLLMLQDQGRNGLLEAPAASFYQNEGIENGEVIWMDVAETTHSDIQISGMGISVLDLNEDHTPDYCVTDTGPIHCLVSDGASGYVDAGIALGLYPAEVDPETKTWSAWSVEAVDLDNDGWVDMAAAGGEPTGGAADALFTDALFQRTGYDSFIDVSEEAGFADPADHFGMAAADLSGDGYLELIIGNPEGPPILWNNPCGAGNWVLFDPVGKPPNVDAFGTKFWVEAGDRRYLGEIQSTRSNGQGPPVFHVGLGELESIDRLIVTWPDGTQESWTDLPVNRKITLYQP